MDIIPKQVRETVDNAAEKLSATAANTKQAVVGAAVIACAALVVAAVAMLLAVAR